MRLFLSLLIVLNLSACSLLTNSPNADTIQHKLSTSQNSNFSYGSGTGKTKEEAIAAARLELSAQIYTHVSSEFNAAQKQVGEDSNGQLTTSNSSEINFLIANYTSVLLSNVQVEDSVKVREGWYARVKMPVNKMEEARLRSDRQAPALAYALLMNNRDTLSASALLRYAILGLDKTLEQNISKETIYAHDIPANTTFEAFFKSAIEEAKSRLRVLPITDENRIRFALIDAKSFEPQTDFVVYVEGYNLETNHSGLTRFIPLDKLPEQFSPFLLGYHEILNSDINKSLLKASSVNVEKLRNFNETTIYVYTQPSQSIITLMNGSKTLASEASPALFKEGADNNMLKIIAEAEGNSHRNVSEIIGTPASANLYYNIKLSESSFGTVDIAVANSKNHITLKDANEVIIARGTNRINKELEVGRYYIHIENLDTANYQSIDDSFSIHKDSVFKREYKPLKNRQFYLNGHFTDLVIGYGSNLSDDFEIPLEDGSVMTNKEFMNDYNSESPHNYSASIRRMRLTNSAIAVTYGLDLGAKRYEEANTTNKAFLYSLGGHFGLGIWTSKFIGKVSWITANYNYSYYEWRFHESKNNLSNTVQPKVDSFSRGYPFLDIGARWDMFGVGVRLSDSSLAAPSLYLSIGATNTESGYQYDAHSTAIKDVNF